MRRIRDVYENLSSGDGFIFESTLRHYASVNGYCTCTLQVMHNHTTFSSRKLKIDESYED